MLVSWSRLYVQKGSEIKSIIDLDHQTIAGLKGSVNLDGPEGIKEIISKFNLEVIIKEMESYEKVFQALHQGRLDSSGLNPQNMTRYQNYGNAPVQEGPGQGS